MLNKINKKNRIKYVLISLAILFLVLSTGIYAGIYSSKLQSSSSKQDEYGYEYDEEVDIVPSSTYGFVPLETFIVNLSGVASFLKTDIQIKYDKKLVGTDFFGDSVGGGFSGGVNAVPMMFKTHMPEIRDRIISVLSAKTSERVLSSTGKDILKEELIEEVNDVVSYDQGPVIDILFTSFIVQ